MDFGFTDEQKELGALTRRILDDKVTEDALRKAEAADTRFDQATWDALAGAGLLAVGLPEALGGSDGGLLEQCVVLVEVGRAVAPVPVLASSVLGAAPIARFGTSELCDRWVAPSARGEVILTAALTEPANRDSYHPVTTATPVDDGWRLDGTKTCVPAGTVADAFVVPAITADGDTIVMVVPRGTAGLTALPQAMTNRDVEAQLILDGVVVDPTAVLGGAEVLEWTVLHGTTALCAQQLGVLEHALEMTAEYTKQRVQFDRPIATFQAVGQRMADSYIDVEGLRLTLWQAVWRLTESLPAATEVEVAKYWAAEAAHRVAHAAVHLHGGTGIDNDYPLHRYFIAAKAIEFALGGATDQLLAIGRSFAADRG